MKKNRTILLMLTGVVIAVTQMVVLLVPAHAVIGLPEDKGPGEPTVAVGRSDIVEVMNSDIAIWSKTNLSTPILSESFQAFLGTPPGTNNCGDPMIEYMPLNDRWALSCTQGSGISLAVSQTGDPAGAWYKWIDQAQTGIGFLDGPKMLITSDKLAIYGGPSGSVDPGEDELWVYPLASLLAGVMSPPVRAVIPNSYGRHFGHPTAVYQNAASVSEDGYFVGQGCTDLGCGFDLLHLSGPPRSPSVTATFAGPSTAPPLPPSNAPIPGGGSAYGSGFFGTGVMSAVAETRTSDHHRVVAFSGQQGCPTDTGRYCTYRDIYDLSTGKLTETWSGEPAYQDELFGSVGLDAAGNLFDSHLYMNASTDPSAGAAGPDWHASIAGATSNAGVQDERFGDYYDAAQDPTDGSKVWFAGAYQISSTGDYGTAFGCGTAAGYGCGGLTPAGSGPKAQYQNLDSYVNDNSIKPGLQLVNNTTAPVTLPDISIRYWFNTNGGSPSFATYCDYAQIGCANITEQVVALATPRGHANAYLQVNFTAGAGDLAVGQDTGQIELRFNKTDWSSFNQAGDYSYATNTAFADAAKVTVYDHDQLVWGAEP